MSAETIKQLEERVAAAKELNTQMLAALLVIAPLLEAVLKRDTKVFADMHDWEVASTLVEAAIQKSANQRTGPKKAKR